jgi:hypothetical protein
MFHDIGSLFGTEGGSQFNALPGAMALADEMKKSLEAGSPTPYTGSTGGGALLAQDLSNDLVMQTLLAEDVKLFKSLYVPQQKAKSVAFEYRRQTSLGPSGPLSLFQAEGVLGSAVDSAFSMEFARCTFMSHVRQATMAMINTGMFAAPGDIVVKMTQDATLYHSHQMEQACFYGDNAADTQSVQGLKGIARTDGTVTDLRGLDITPDDIEKYAVEMHEGAALGRPNQFYAPFAVRKQIGYTVADSIRRQLGVGESSKFRAGQIVDTLDTNVGTIPLIGTRFLAPQRLRMTSLTAIGETAPTAPTLTSVVAGALGGGEVSQFVTADAGNYYYVVAAIGSKGVSFVKSNVTAVNANEKVTITIEAPGTDNVRLYMVFRTKLGGSTEWWPIQAKAQTYAGGNPAATVVTDFNDDLPGTADCYLIENSPDSMHWREHTPFSRIALPIPSGTLVQPYGFIQFGALLATKRYIVRRFRNVNVPSIS